MLFFVILVYILMAISSIVNLLHCKQVNFLMKVLVNTNWNSLNKLYCQGSSMIDIFIRMIIRMEKEKKLLMRSYIFICMSAKHRYNRLLSDFQTVKEQIRKKSKKQLSDYKRLVRCSFINFACILILNYFKLDSLNYVDICIVLISCMTFIYDAFSSYKSFKRSASTLKYADRLIYFIKSRRRNHF